VNVHTARRPPEVLPDDSDIVIRDIGISVVELGMD
jgi:hypothetical protein